MNNLSVMIKPSSGLCNLNCKYCFYCDEISEREIPNYGFMSFETSHKVLNQILDYSNGGNISIAFQGGEPLLIGIDYYKDFIEYINMHNNKKSVINISIQTNGTLIDETWASFFAENKIFIGVSLDGDFEANSYRVYKSGKPSFNDVISSLKILEKNDVEYNILSVITARNAKNIKNIYNYFKNNGYRFLQFIPCLKPFNSSTLSLEMKEQDYTDYLFAVFSMYIKDYISGDYVSIRYFDNLIRMMNNLYPEQCGMNGFCSRQLVFEANGNIYPCDFYCTDEWLLGNITENTLSEIISSSKMQKFLNDSLSFDPECKSCHYQLLCRGGGCKRQRTTVDYCNSYKNFFSKVYDIIDKYNIQN